MGKTLEALAAKFGDVRMFRTCEQCGCCASACPITGINDFNVRRIVRHIELDLAEEIAGTPFPWACTTCGRCETVCPNGIAILDIIRPLRAMAPQEYVPEVSAPCAHACPGGIDVPGYVRLIGQGGSAEARKLIMESVPLPGVLGRVCAHPCETACRRSEVNQPISICALKRYAADRSGPLKGEEIGISPDTGHSVAVIGSGPAGLTAAYFLRRKGHRVTIFEGRPKAGGMMRYGIPAHRLPEEVLDQEIGEILGLGIELRTDQRLGRDFDLQGLKAQGFEAVFAALGLQEGRKMDLEGREMNDVLWGLDFLSAVKEGKDLAVRDRVLVVGGGNVAVDVALTALRLGAKDVTMACLEARSEMPANPWEIDMAVEEGVRLMPSWGPKRILGENGKVTGIELHRCASVFDDKGNFCPAFEDVVEVVKGDQVILAIGQAADLAGLEGDDGVEIKGGLIAADGETLETVLPGVFAGGEAVAGPGAMIEAMASAKRAAAAIDRFLGGDGVLERRGAETDLPAYDGKREKGFADLTRVPEPVLPVSERHAGSPEVALCLSDEQAVCEAKRCLQCDLEYVLAKGEQPAGE